VLRQAVQVPFAWRMARRLRRAQEAEAASLRAAVDASQAERRRIARDVHDGVVQDLAGLAFGLDAARFGGVDGEVPGAAARTAAGLRRCLGELRRLLVDLDPPPLPGGGLGPALGVLARGLEREGRDVAMDVEGADGLPRPAAALLHRCALEAVRNVSAHSGARRVGITLTTSSAAATLTVADDGVGIDELRRAARTAAGHLGLRAMADLLAEAGGSLAAESVPGRGTRLVATVPLEPAPVAAVPVG
jgi:signal transduction histidine kinase